VRLSNSQADSLIQCVLITLVLRLSMNAFRVNTEWVESGALLAACGEQHGLRVNPSLQFFWLLASSSSSSSSSSRSSRRSSSSGGSSGSSSSRNSSS